MKNNNIKTLIVGVEFSDYSKIVVREAKQLAAQLKIPLVYVFVYEDFVLYEDTVTLNRAKIKELYEEKIRRVYGVDEDSKIVVRFGQPAKEILSVAKKEKNPMIIIGHKGGHAIARFFLGSVAEKLASTTKFPLWIHRGEKVRMPNNILIPADLSKRSDRTISEVNALKKTFNSKIEIYHVIEEPLPILDYANWSTVYGHIIAQDTKKLNAFRDKHPTLKTVREQGSVVYHINRHAEKEKFDVIAISPHEKIKDRVAFGRVTGKIIRSGDKPVLVIP